jgi:peptide/nickel transport system substrate-binding protein
LRQVDLLFAGTAAFRFANHFGRRLMEKDTSLQGATDVTAALVGLSAQGATRREVLRALAAAGMMSVTGAGLLSESGGAFAQATPKSGGKFRVATQSTSSADTLDPAKDAFTTDYVRDFMVYSGLTELDSHLGAKMALATSIETKDATVWVAKLRSGVKFHDGKEFTPADVVYSIMRHKDLATASKAKSVADQIKEVKATGPYEGSHHHARRPERRSAGQSSNLTFSDHQGRH